MHTKRIASGRGKTKRWATTANPGPHNKDRCIALLSLVRDYMGYTDNAREAKAIIHAGDILVDKKPRKDHKFPVGLMDVIEIPKLKKYYRIVPTQKGLDLKDIAAKDADAKFCKIVGKNMTAKGGIQLALHDGTTLIPDEKDYKVNDTLVLSLPDRKIKNTIKFEKDAKAVVFEGIHRGQTGEIKEVIAGTATRDSVTDLGNIKTLTAYSFAIGNDKVSMNL